MAWKEFRRGKRKKPEVQQFEFNLEDNLFQLNRELERKEYIPLPYKDFYIRDPKLRHIHKADVRDRVVYQAVFRILYPVFDRQFIHDSFSSRLGKGTHAGVDRLESFLRKASKNFKEPTFVLKCDISKFFDSVDHRILMSLIKKRISNSDVIWLIEIILNSFHKAAGRGLPLGNVTSQLFANIYLNELDQFIKHQLKIKYYVRYCDDFAIIDKPTKFPDLIKKISNFIKENLQLQLHPKKIIIKKYSQGIDFLGYVLRPYHRLVRTKTKRRMLKKINKHNAASYFGILKHCDSCKIKKEILDIIEKL